MPTKRVEFQYFTGLTRPIFRNPRLRGSWDVNGRYSDSWTDSPMQVAVGDDGCPLFKASIDLDLADQQRTFKWGVVLDGPQGSNFWGIPTELRDVNSFERYREFQLAGGNAAQVERYYFTYLRRLGANKDHALRAGQPDLRFAVWAPHATAVDVVFADPVRPYIADDGTGIDATRAAIALTKTAGAIWEGGPQGTFESVRGLPYMYRIKNAQGTTVYRTDIFSRSQAGRGKDDPMHTQWSGSIDTLDGTVSCSVVIDADVVRREFASTPAGTQPDLIPADEFWATEFTPGLPVPTRIEDLVIYELHVGSLGFGRAGPGTLSDAMAFVKHLVDLGVNAVELLPMAEFSGTISWGYGDTHYLCIESSAGGRDKYRHFVRECHRRGIAVLQDVVYNHYDPLAERAESQYDSTAPEQNIYYWYEGSPSDHSHPDVGYLDNGSTGRLPRLWEEAVRQQFISAAAFLIEEMHVDGLRVDLTQALHRDNHLSGDGFPSVPSANIFGQKLLREWSRTLHMIRPSAMLIAEDHTGWNAVTKLPAQRGLGFDGTWDNAFYHNLVGDSDMAGGKARLLKEAGFGGSQPLHIDWFAGALYGTSYSRIVFHESHDEAGNAGGTERTIRVAVNDAPLFGATRMWAEARSRVCCGLSLLSAGTPMFFMGEEIGAQKHYTYSNFLANREDIAGERAGNGCALFRFYQELVTLRRRFPSIYSRNIDMLHQSNENRVIGFKRWFGSEEIIVVASLNEKPFLNGYVIEKDTLAIPDALWKEIFNSDSSAYGGQNVGNLGGVIMSTGARINAVVPATGFVVLVKQ
jgi:1,4-alpha-glucan branching enzyme